MGDEQENTRENTTTRFTDAISENFLFKESGKIIGISTFSFALAAFFLKSLWYFYQWGKFNALKVSTLYIDMGNGNQALYSAIAFCAVVFIFVLSNIVVYNLIQKKKYGKVAGLIVGESFVLFIIMIIISNINLHYEITRKNGLIQILEIFLFILLITIVLNLWGAIGLVSVKSQRNVETGEAESSYVKVIGKIFVAIMGVICFQIFIFYLTGHCHGNREQNFKLILKYESKSDLIGMDEKYIFSNDSTDSLMVLQAVLIETQNEYITCYCYEKDERIYANINMQRVIPKENIVTMNGYNIEKVLK